VVLHAARALQPKTGVKVEPAYVEVAGGKVVAVTAQAPGGDAKVVELGDATILPGLVDAHTHLLHLETPDESSMVGEVVTMSEADRALRGVRFAAQMLDCGFTTVRDLGNSGRGGDVSLRRAVQRGWVEGPNILASTRALSAPGGQFPKLGAAHHGLVAQEYAEVRGADDARAKAREAFYEGADVIKVIVDNGIPGRSMTLEELRAVVEIAHEAGKKVAAHVLGEKAAEIAVQAGVDSLDHAYAVTDATLVEMARRRIFLVPTDYPLDYYLAAVPTLPQAAMKSMHDASAARLGRAIRMKVPIAAGSDAYLKSPLDHRGKEARLIFRAYAEAGMTPLAIVQSATTNAAELLGLPAGSGTLEAGSAADLLVVRGDPSADVGALAQPLVVLKAGVVVRDFR